jgi:DNA-binding XRE family transcriptional regulator
MSDLMSDLRAAARQSTARTGIIEFEGARGTVSIPCTIADVSGTGARLKLDWSLAFPKEATLMMTEEEQALHRRHIGAQLKGAREARGYTEAQIADLVGVSPEFISGAERGEVSIPLHQLTHMADLFLVDLDSLVAGPASIDLPPVHYLSGAAAGD